MFKLLPHLVKIRDSAYSWVTVNRATAELLIGITIWSGQQPVAAANTQLGARINVLACHQQAVAFLGAAAQLVAAEFFHC